jgi:DNA polymerase-3 subunit beta
MAKSSSTSLITVQRTDFLPALALARGIVERRNTIPILGNVLLRVAPSTGSGGELTLRATDLDSQASATVPCAGATSAETTLPAASLHDIVRKLPEGAEIALSGDDREWKVAAGRSTFRLPCLPASDFPEMAAADGMTEFQLPAEALKRMIDTVRFAVSTEETRYYLNGIHWHRGQNDAGEPILVAVATDGHRLSRLPLPLPEPLDLPPVILSRRMIDQLAKILPEKGDVEVGLSAAKVSFRFDHVALVSKLVDGTFPDYNRVVPSGNGNRFTVDRQALFAGIDRVTTISSERGRAVKFSFADGEVKLACSNPDSGSAEEIVAASCLAGAPVEIGFNGRYCLDMLSAAASENVVFELGDAGAPALIRPEPSDDASPFFVIMPMRV